MSEPYNPRAVWTFFKQGFAKWEQTASIVPSQKYLVDAMVDGARPERARTIVELGPGVGVMTKPLLSRMSSDASLYTIEIDPPIHEELVRAVRDPRLHAICGSAEHIRQLLEQHGHHGPVDAVVSSLGMSLIPAAVRERIVDAVTECLAPDGVYMQFGYMHTRYFIYTRESGIGTFDYRGYLRARFDDVRRKPVPINFPPAWVYESRHPVASRSR